ncbi:MAG: uracil-DNA glycosylase, partial [Hyphomicrobium sp.]
MARSVSKASRRQMDEESGDLFATAQPSEPRTLAALNEEMAAAGPMVEGGKRAVCGEGPKGAA